MKNILIFIALCSFPLLLHSQTDTLYCEKGNKSKTDRSAIKYYNKAIEVNPKYAKAYYSRALSYFERKKFKKVLGDCNKTLELDSSFIDAYILIAVTNRRKKNYEKALYYFNIAVLHDSLNLCALENRGAYFSEINENIKAEKDLLKVISLSKDSIGIGNAYYNLGLVYIDQKKYGDAIFAFTESIKLFPTRDAYKGRSIVYSVLGELEKSETDKKKYKTLKKLGQFDL